MTADQLTFALQVTLVAVAMLGAATLTAVIMRRIDKGDLRGIGPWFGGLAVALAATIAIARVLAEGKELAEHAPYVAVLLVLLSAALAWAFLQDVTQVSEKEWAARARSLASPPMLLVLSGAVLVAVLWVVALGVSRFGVLPPESGGLLPQAAAAGFLAMAVIQGIRTLVPVRGAFHRAALVRWIDESIKASETSNKTNDVLKEIVELASPASSVSHYALFDLPIEQLCGQIGAGADRLLDSSEQAAEITPDTTPIAEREAAIALLSVLAASPVNVRELVRRSTNESMESRGRMRLRAGIAQRIQRNIDRLQIGTTFWWRRLLRGQALAICWVIGLTLLKNPLPAVVFAIVGGFTATVARDVVAIVEKSRR